MLRALAIIGVVVLHISGQIVSSYSSSGLYNWLIGNFINSLTRWCVPIFIMISGALILNSDNQPTINIFLRKKITRVLLPLITWSIIYSIWSFRKEIVSCESISILNIIMNFFEGRVYFHLWFSYMIIGLYFITPILWAYIKGSTKENQIYFIVIWLVATSLYSFIYNIFGLSIGFKIEYLNGFIGYYFLGFFCHTYAFNKINTKLLCFIVFCTILFTFFSTSIFTINNNQYCDYFHSSSSPNIVILSIVFFIYIKKINYQTLYFKRMFLKKIIKEISRLSYGIYLSHALIYHMLMLKILPINITAKLIHPVIGIPITVITVFMLSLVLCKMIIKIPILNKMLIS